MVLLGKLECIFGVVGLLVCLLVHWSMLLARVGNCKNVQFEYCTFECTCIFWGEGFDFVGPCPDLRHCPCLFDVFFISYAELLENGTKRTTAQVTAVMKRIEDHYNDGLYERALLLKEASSEEGVWCSVPLRHLNKFFCQPYLYPQKRTMEIQIYEQPSSKVIRCM